MRLEDYKKDIEQKIADKEDHIEQLNKKLFEKPEDEKYINKVKN